ncbi:hypothetical protein LO763_19615 [Glycomyces sp. A-F 0318]|uniref:hypothetical protein n=1 Tax=Glycomyces amatae TaxID=2881355 RepID=UPI001E2FDFA7|nr:hypothetical protein [Glycomyces amatae]MCD0445820.1 hypothetical protein [Glycomyces amatae]
MRRTHAVAKRGFPKSRQGPFKATGTVRPCKIDATTTLSGTGFPDRHATFARR